MIYILVIICTVFQIRDFVDRFMPAYRTYLPQLHRESDDTDIEHKLLGGPQRRYIGHSMDQECDGGLYDVLVHQCHGYSPCLKVSVSFVIYMVTIVFIANCNYRYLLIENVYHIVPHLSDTSMY
jgi:hypothetical protein